MTLLTPAHFCEVPVASCSSQTRYRNPLHIDVFRVLSLEEATTLMDADERGQEPRHGERGDEGGRPKRQNQSGDLLEELQGRRPNEPHLLETWKRRKRS